ncbi:intermembrane transport protein PqiB [Pseudocolwellia sp. AS88]|uniref:intermembrane transport protein PqiB n=1 Tax=Pseudocolwellia sp. AS88 TaxID=3063958 RepID=UPI0026E9E4B0|nr:intermembrane transport protein PqiB [Pseudocolwellia sp. AS88]MDO7086219.1 intermembrane transport protein PqiB [Pseudocolwellia sp. AS88]
MTPENNELPEAVVKPVNRISTIWLIPLIALTIGAWMVIDQWLKQGPLITIEFSNAQGISPKESLIKLRNITVGKVVDIKLNDKLDGVIVSARMNRKASELLTKDSNFWVVKPRVSLSSVSGLSTILSGYFIEFSPGEEKTSKYHFVGLENPPSTPIGTPGLHITLDSSSDNAFDIGAPVLFRGSQAGRIEYAHLNTEEGKMYYNVFIEAPYDKLITTNTRFWEVTGIDFELSGQGVRINTGTIETLLGGGVSFDVPAYLTKGEPIKEHAQFSIFPNKQKVNERVFYAAQSYMLLFNQSIRGLKPGSPVEYKGLHIGEVVRTDIDYPEMSNVLDKNTLLPIMIKIYPGRLGLKDDEIGLHKMQRDMNQWITSGLHGAISNNNLLLGSKYIELKYIDSSLEAPETFGDLLLIPTADDELEQVMTRVSNITKSIEEIPFNDIIKSTSKALKVITESMDQFDSTSERFENLLNDPKSQTLIAQINSTLKGVESLTKSYSDGSKTNQQLNDVLQSLDKTINNLTPLIMKLNMQPNRLIFNSDNAEVQPTAGN